MVIAALRVLPIPVKLVPDSAIRRHFERPLSELGPTKVVEIQRAPLAPAQRGLKQVLDRCLAGACLFLLMPLFAVTALADPPLRNHPDPRFSCKSGSGSTVALSGSSSFARCRQWTTGRSSARPSETICA